MKILDRFKNDIDQIRSKIDEQNINFYINYVVNSLFEANKYFNDQAPWDKKDDPIRLNTIIYTTFEIVRKISFMLYPIIPESSLKALKIFEIQEKDIDFSTLTNHKYLQLGKKLFQGEILFKKILKKND